MATHVGIRKFKDGVSGYIDRVTAGEVVTVTKRGKPVARLVPADTSPGVARLMAEGRIEWSGGKPLELPPPTPLHGDGLTAVDYVREGRR